MFFIPPSGGIKKEKGETFMPISITARSRITPARNWRPWNISGPGTPKPTW